MKACEVFRESWKTVKDSKGTKTPKSQRMQRITGLFHPKASFVYALSKMFERGAYYGFRALIVLYMVEALELSREDALSIYGTFTSALLFAAIVGGMLGDLTLGSKKSVILGGVLQGIGAFCCCTSTYEGMVVGLILFVLGDGLYSPNHSAGFGKLYLTRTKLMDAGFSLLYLIINIGAFLGVVVIGWVGEMHGWNYGFMIAGACMLMSALPLTFVKEIERDIPRPNRGRGSDHVVKILLAILAVGLFWTVYDFAGDYTWELQTKFANLYADSIPESLWQGLNAAFTIPLTLFATVLWSFYYSSQFSKLVTGSLFAAASFALLMLVPDAPNEGQVLFFLGSMLLFSIGEVFIGPVVQSVITQYANPKYLAIVMSVAFLPSRLLTIALGWLALDGSADASNTFLWSAITMAVVGVGLLLYIGLSKPEYKDQTMLDSDT